MKRGYRIYDTGKSTQDFSQLPPLAGRGESVNLMQQPLSIRQNLKIPTKKPEFYIYSILFV
ncbi:hypothetical protein COJ10_15940 [Bacillus thuringiensis]|nr:hypothetical protein COJ10_15940 [Bacillus thuringiensis]